MCMKTVDQIKLSLSLSYGWMDEMVLLREVAQWGAKIQTDQPTLLIIPLT